MEGRSSQKQLPRERELSLGLAERRLVTAEGASQSPRSHGCCQLLPQKAPPRRSCRCSKLSVLKDARTLALALDAALGAGQRAEPGSAARTCCEVGSPRWPESQTGLGGSSGLSLQQEVKTPRRAGTPGLWRQLWPGWTRVTGCLCGAGERAARASREASEGAPVPLGRLV